MIHFSIDGLAVESRRVGVLFQSNPTPGGLDWRLVLPAADAARMRDVSAAIDGVRPLSASVQQSILMALDWGPLASTTPGEGPFAFFLNSVQELRRDGDRVVIEGRASPVTVVVNERAVSPQGGPPE